MTAQNIPAVEARIAELDQVVTAARASAYQASQAGRSPFKSLDIMDEAIAEKRLLVTRLHRMQLVQVGAQ